MNKDEFKDMNGASRRRDRYFDRSGRQVKVTKRLLGLERNLPDPTLLFLESDEPMTGPPRLYPFSIL